MGTLLSSKDLYVLSPKLKTLICFYTFCYKFASQVFKFFPTFVKARVRKSEDRNSIEEELLSHYEQDVAL